MAVKVRISNDLLIRRSHAKDLGILDTIKEENTKYFIGNPGDCNRCPKVHVRPTNCQGCENFSYHETYDVCTFKSVPVVRIWRGYKDRLAGLIADTGTPVKWVDAQSKAEVSTNKYRFNRKLLRPEQVEMVDFLLETIREGGSGILKAPPRTGKTVIAACVTLESKRKTIIIAHQSDLLKNDKQLMGTFLGKTKEGVPFTNIPKAIEKGHNVIKYCRKLEDFIEHDICLTTYQIFLSDKGQELLKEVKNLFGLVIVDECFPEGAKVALGDGSFETIENIVKDPESYSVMSFNHGTGVPEVKPVISGSSKKVRTSIVTLSYNGGKLRLTANHPVWSHTRNEYIRADQIQAGEDVEVLD